MMNKLPFVTFYRMLCPKGRVARDEPLRSTLVRTAPFLRSENFGFTVFQRVLGFFGDGELLVLPGVYTPLTWAYAAFAE
jgi:hypothetical protein